MYRLDLADERLVLPVAVYDAKGRATRLTCGWATLHAAERADLALFTSSRSIGRERGSDTDQGTPSDHWSG